MDKRTKQMQKSLQECVTREVSDPTTSWPEIRSKLFASTVPAVWEADLSVPLNQEVTVNDVNVTLDQVYADTGHVVVAFAVNGLVGQLHRDVRMETNLYNSKNMPLEKVGGHGISWGQERPSIPEGSWAEATVFEIPNEIEATGRQLFRFELEVHGLVPGDDGERSKRSPQSPSTGPFVFEFEVDVHAVPTLLVGQRVETRGLSLLLERVENSPVRTRVFIHFDPPDDAHDWMPVVRTGSLSRFIGEGRLAENPVTRDTCSTFTFDESLYNRPGSYPLTVTEILGVPYVRERPRKITGPWNFRFRITRSQQGQPLSV